MGNSTTKYPGSLDDHHAIYFVTPISDFFVKLCQGCYQFFAFQLTTLQATDSLSHLESLFGFYGPLACFYKEYTRNAFNNIVDNPHFLIPISIRTVPTKQYNSAWDTLFRHSTRYILADHMVEDIQKLLNRISLLFY